MVENILIGMTAKAVVKGLIERIHISIKKALGLAQDPVTVAFDTVLYQSLQDAFTADAELYREFFTASFLKHEAASIVATILTPDENVTGSFLATALANYHYGGSRLNARETETFLHRVTPFCNLFLARLQYHARANPALLSITQAQDTATIRLQLERLNTELLRLQLEQESARTDVVAILQTRHTGEEKSMDITDEQVELLRALRNIGGTTTYPNYADVSRATQKTLDVVSENFDALEVGGYVELIRTSESNNVKLTEQGEHILNNLDFGSGSQAVRTINIYGTTHIAVLNNGHIGLITQNINTLTDKGNSEVAEALKQITAAVIREDSEISEQQRADLLEYIQEISTQAALPVNKRKLGVIAILLTGLGSTLQNSAAVAQIWETCAPVIKAFFGIA